MPTVSVLTLIAALIAAIVAAAGVYYQRRSGREAAAAAGESAAAARQSAEAAKTSSEASTRSAKAAEDNVELNAVTAAGVASRAHQDALSKRYQDAASQLGSDKAAVRLAGAYALARLADDWPEQRPQCVDVLCAYIRMPVAGSTEQEARGDNAVRSAIVKLIGDHLLVDRPTNWCDCEIDLSHGSFEGLIWHSPTFKRNFIVSHAHIRSDFWLTNATFGAAVHFIGTNFGTKCSIENVKFSTDRLLFNLATFGAGGNILFGRISEGSAVDFTRAVISGQLSVHGSKQSEPQGSIILSDLLVTDEGKLRVEGFGPDPTTQDAYPTVAVGASVRVSDLGRAELPPFFHEINDPDDNGLGHTWKYDLES